ncbi:MAG: ATP-binding cassette domain-containing protein, partial [bacterium]|nr:ATP-binding cassette domain-containing protein [bacterium]
MIRVRHIAKSFGPRPVLQDISFVVPRGKTTVIIGTSGCGKSTL